MRVINFQLDAASPLFIYTHLDQLPFLASKIFGGTSGILHCYGSSSISWTSFWTGKSPHAHGIWGFWNDGSSRRVRRVMQAYVDSPGEFLAGSYKPMRRALKRWVLGLRPVLSPMLDTVLRRGRDGKGSGRCPNTRTDIRCPTGYDILEDAGLKVGLVNSIYTYPAWETSGYMICDWTMPVGTTDYYYPQEIGGYLEALGYRQTLDTLKQYWGWLEGTMSDDPDAIYCWSLEMFEKVKQVTIHLLKTQTWDFHATMFRFLDTMQHMFVDDPQRLIEAYQLVDSGLAEIAAATGLDRDDDLCWLINSDHGMTQTWSERTIKGGHDLSGFYCFAMPEMFRSNHRYTLRIEDLMPVVLRLYGINSFEMPFNHGLDQHLFVQNEREVLAVEDRLRALGYL